VLEKERITRHDYKDTMQYGRNKGKHRKGKHSESGIKPRNDNRYNEMWKTRSLTKT